MHSKKELDERLRACGISPIKKLGQNFLVNPRICKTVIDKVLESKPASVVEIGPGLGALTDSLVESQIPLTLVEFDSGLVKYWEARRVKIIHEDALRINWSEFETPRPCHLVSNLPYSIAASIVMELSGLQVFDEMTLMFQKEVAERIAADFNSEDYGMLSVVAQTFWEIHKLIDAGPQDFHPVPNVGSRVLYFKAKSSSIPIKDFVTFVKLAFSQRRKKMSKNLEPSFNMTDLNNAFVEMGLSGDVRAQELNPEQFQKLYSILNSH